MHMFSFVKNFCLVSCHPQSSHVAPFVENCLVRMTEVLNGWKWLPLHETELYISMPQLSPQVARYTNTQRLSVSHNVSNRIHPLSYTPTLETHSLLLLCYPTLIMYTFERNIMHDRFIYRRNTWLIKHLPTSYIHSAAYSLASIL